VSTTGPGHGPQSLLYILSKAYDEGGNPTLKLYTIALFGEIESRIAANCFSGICYSTEREFTYHLMKMI
jgi:hypothetical protein